MFNNFFISKIVLFMREFGKKYRPAERAIDDNMAHAHCMLDMLGYKPILRICNNYCCSTATMNYERALVLRYIYNACLLLNSWKNSLRQSLNYCGVNEFSRLKYVCYLLIESATGILKGTNHRFLKKFRHC
jgi:hypothetical protein